MRPPLQIQLGYGARRTLLQVPRECLAWWHPGPPEGELARAHPSLPAPFGAAASELLASGLAEAVAGRPAALLVADGTRPWDPAERLPGLLELLAPARSVTLFVCSGTHDAGTPEARRLRSTLADLAGPRVALVWNDARGGRFASAGATARGTPVEIDPRLLECEVWLVLSEARPHYFAGYSNPVKFVVPGLSSFETARANHAWALEPGAAVGRHPWHPDPARRRNPVAEDMVEAFELARDGRPAFALAHVQRAGACVWAAGAPVRAATERALAAVDARLSVAVEPVDLLVLSCGGHPLDESLYTAQRALELSCEAVRDGGEVLFLAECRNGIGPPGARENFFEPLCASPGGAAPSREGYRMYGHKPVRFARQRDRLRALHLASRLDADDVLAARMRPVADPQEVVTGWLARSGARIGVLDEGAATWVRAAPAPGQVPMP